MKFNRLLPILVSLIVVACDVGGFEILSPEGLAAYLSDEALASFDISSGTFTLSVPPGAMGKTDAEEIAMILAESVLKSIIIGAGKGDVSLCGSYYSHSVYDDPPGLQRDDGQFGDFWIFNLCADGRFEAVAEVYARSPKYQQIPHILRYSEAFNIRDMDPLLTAEEAASLLIDFLGEDVRLVAIPRLINGWAFDGTPATYAKWEFQVVERGEGTSMYYVGRFTGNEDRRTARDDFVVMRAIGERRKGMLQGRTRRGPDRFELVEGQ